VEKSATLCVLDPSLFEEGLLGQRLLPILRHLRAQGAIAPGAEVVPRQAVVHAVLASITSRSSGNLNLAAADAKYVPSFLPSFRTVLLSFLPPARSFLSFLPSFRTVLPSFLPSVRSFLPSFLPSILAVDLLF
jgi:hypothetical protein